jgi:hypothetical protein
MLGLIEAIFKANAKEGKMKIAPIDSSGEPVDVLNAVWKDGTWKLTVSCQNSQHGLTLTRDKQLTIHDHRPDEQQGEEAVAKLADMAALAGNPGVACPCIRVKLWLATGIYIIHVIP